jgi:hypothetical protein
MRNKGNAVSDFLPTLTQASSTLVSIVVRGGLVMIPLLTDVLEEHSTRLELLLGERED